MESLLTLLPLFDSGSGTFYDLRHLTMHSAPKVVVRPLIQEWFNNIQSVPKRSLSELLNLTLPCHFEPTGSESPNVLPEIWFLKTTQSSNSECNFFWTPCLASIIRKTPHLSIICSRRSPDGTTTQPTSTNCSPSPLLRRKRLLICSGKNNIPPISVQFLKNLLLCDVFEIRSHV